MFPRIFFKSIQTFCNHGFTVKILSESMSQCRSSDYDFQEFLWITLNSIAGSCFVKESLPNRNLIVGITAITAFSGCCSSNDQETLPRKDFLTTRISWLRLIQINF